MILIATLPADSNFNAIVVKNCPNKLNIPPTNNIPVSIHVFGRIDPSMISAIIVDAKNPTIPKQVVGTVRCRSMIYKNIISIHICVDVMFLDTL